MAFREVKWIGDRCGVNQLHRFRDLGREEKLEVSQSGGVGRSGKMAQGSSTPVSTRRPSPSLSHYKRWLQAQFLHLLVGQPLRRKPASQCRLVTMFSVRLAGRLQVIGPEGGCSSWRRYKIRNCQSFSQGQGWPWIGKDSEWLRCESSHTSTFLRRQIYSFNVYDLIWSGQQPCGTGWVQGVISILQIRTMSSRGGSGLAKVTLVSRRAGTWTQVSRLSVSGSHQELCFPSALLGGLWYSWMCRQLWRSQKRCILFQLPTPYAFLSLLGQSGMISNKTLTHWELFWNPIRLESEGKDVVSLSGCSSHVIKN